MQVGRSLIRSIRAAALTAIAASRSTAAAGFLPAESRGALWLVAAVGVGLLIPFNLLMMAPPSAIMSAGM
jgi:hypothetical protein